MNLKSNLDDHLVLNGYTSAIKRSTLSVWRFLLSIANRTVPPTTRFQVSRKEIQEGTRIGSLNTIDSALEDLESCNLLCRYPAPGANDGQIYELLTLDEKPIPNINRWHIITSLRQIADKLEGNDRAMTLEQIVKWSKLTYQAQRLLKELL